MTIAEFIKSDSLPDEALTWVLSRKVETPIGDFEVYLHNIEDTDKSPPNVQMVRLAEEILNFVREQSYIIVDIVYGSYKSSVADGSIALVRPPISSDVTRDDIMDYVFSRKLGVSRHSSANDHHYSCRIGIRIPWDEEHGLDLNYRSGAIEFINDDPFHFENGVLVLG